MIVPAVVGCFLSTPYWEVAFVAAFDYDPFVPIGKTFNIMFGDSWQYLWPVIVISIFQILGATLITSAMDRHFRTGEFSLKSPLQLINIAVFPMTIGVLIMCGVNIVWRFAQFGLVSLTQTIAAAAGFSAGAALSIISVVAVVMFFFHVLILIPIMFWAPVMIIYGYRFRDAAAMSFKLLSGKKVFWGMFLPLLFCAAIQLMVGFLNVHVSIRYVVNFIVALLTDIYVPVYVMIAFNTIGDLGRRDLKPYENIPMPTVQKQDSAKPKKADTAQAEKAVDQKSDPAADSTKPSKPATPKKTQAKKTAKSETSKKTQTEQAEKPAAPKKKQVKKKQTGADNGKKPDKKDEKAQIGDVGGEVDGDVV